jgi:hypothetical protein
MSFKKEANGENTDMAGIREREIGRPVSPVSGCQATNPDWRKMPRNRPDKDEKHLAYSVLIANGISREKAASMLGYSPKTARSIDRALKEKGLKLELLSEQRIKKAHRVIDKCLAGKGFGGVETIKDSTALRAAEAILDRSNPKAQTPPAPTYQFTKVDLNQFRYDYKPPVESPGEEPVLITLGEDKETGEEP